MRIAETKYPVSVHGGWTFELLKLIAEIEENAST
jgi:hypothetical protein